MKIKWLWIINAFILLAFLVIELLWVQLKIRPTEDPWGELLFEVIGLLSYLFAMIVFTAGLTALIAIIPFRRLTYGRKYKSILPVVTIATLIIFVAAVAYPFIMVKYYGQGVMVYKQFETINTPANLDCASIRNGKFETDQVAIERFESRQIHTFKKTKEKIAYQVEWNGCEYTLTSIKDSAEKLFVKITEINSDNYKCYVTSNTKFGGRIALYYLKKIK